MILANIFFQGCLAIIAVSTSALPAEAAGSDLPKWLGGKPDIDTKAERCGVYEWFFQQADLQSEGMVSKNEFASMRLISIANKLVEHHLAEPAESYSAGVRYLLIGTDPDPFHFQFKISSSELERIMKIEKERCAIVPAHLLETEGDGSTS